METRKVLRRLRFVTKFKNVDVPVKHLFEIIDTARWAFGFRNFSSIEFIVIKKPETVLQLSEVVQSKKDAIKTAAYTVAICSNLDRLSFHLKKNATIEDAIVEATAAMEHIAIASRDIGLAVAVYFWFDRTKVQEILKCPKDVVPIFLVSIGYPAEFTDLIRPPLPAILHIEEFGKEWEKEMPEVYRKSDSSSTLLKLFG